MKISFDLKAIEPMFNWLLKSKKENIRDEVELRNILKLPEYKVEFERYENKNLPVCNINYEEAVDFFLNFDKKDFENKRLQYKKPYFLKFYDNLEKNIKLVDIFKTINDEDVSFINNLLTNGLPKTISEENVEYKILLVISIGNSMGWPYGNYIDFDVANLGMIKDKASFLHIVAHEIYHTFFSTLLPEEFTPLSYFVLNFAFEGLAVHFMNNAFTKNKKSKYDDKVYAMDDYSWDIYLKCDKELFDKFLSDYKKVENSKITVEEVGNLISNNYEQFTYKSELLNKEFKIAQYPTYYLGCYIWGSIDLVFGKDVIFDVMKNPSKFLEVYNSAAKELGNTDYLIK